MKANLTIHSKQLTVKEIEGTDALEGIMEQYENGSDDAYEIVGDDGEVLGVLTPYDGPWQSKLEDTEDGTGDCIVNIPKRLISKLGLEEGTEVEVIPNEDGSLEIKKK